jgi:hypothetical protein
MCKNYNTIGSLTTLKSHLDRNNIHDFKSLKEVIDFQNSYTTYREQIISHHENSIEQEKNILNRDLQQLDTTIESQKLQSEKKLTDEIDKLKEKLNISTGYDPPNFFKSFIRYLRKRNYIKKIKYKERNFDFEVQRSINKLVEIRQDKNNRYQFIISQFNDAVRQSSQHPLSELERKKATIDELSSFIYGAFVSSPYFRATCN